MRCYIGILVHEGGGGRLGIGHHSSFIPGSFYMSPFFPSQFMSDMAWWFRTHDSELFEVVGSNPGVIMFSLKKYVR